MIEYTVTFNKGADVFQHVYHSILSEKEFRSLMNEEWMIDGDDQITIEVLQPA